MLDPNLRETLSKAYAKIGEISYTIALNMRKGKNNVPSQKALYDQGIKMYAMLDVLFRHVTFDEDNGNLPTLWRITEEEVNKLTRCLIQIGQLNTYPVVPSLYPNTRPVIIQTGPQGIQGPPGANGTNANIVVELDPAEKQLKLIETNLGATKTYTFSFVHYVAPLLTVAIQGGKVFEIGDERDFDILVTSTKGTEEIVTIVCDDGTVDASLQGLLNLVSANNELSQPYQILVPVTAIGADQTFEFTTDDQEQTVIASDTINFYYPYLFGNSAITGITHYTALTKSIVPKANRAFAFNGTDQYFWIAYPSSYGDLTAIKDQNGFNVIADFTASLVNITSSGLDNNWTVEYRVYRTTLKTTISNANFTIEY